MGDAAIGLQLRFEGTGLEMLVVQPAQDIAGLHSEKGAEAVAQGQLDGLGLVGELGLVVLLRIRPQAVEKILQVFVVLELGVEGQPVFLVLADFQVRHGEREDVPAFALARIEQDQVEGFLLAQVIDEFDLPAVSDADVPVIHDDGHRAEGFIRTFRDRPVGGFLGGESGRKDGQGRRGQEDPLALGFHESLLLSKVRITA